jgi:translation initiation factor 4E
MALIILLGRQLERSSEGSGHIQLRGRILGHLRTLPTAVRALGFGTLTSPV